jgi:major type 1 subunit fimbrin (pilin)
MKKILLSAALAAVFGVVALAPQAATATDGTITFAGKISSSTCTIGSSGTPSTGGSFTVTLPTVSTGALGTSSGTVAGTTPFSINLSNCTSALNGGSVKAYFEPGSTINTNGRLNTAVAGVDLQVLNSGQTGINLSTQAGTTSATVTGGSATLAYYVQYYNNGANGTGAVGSGTVGSSVNYSIVYP